ncbi:hypothetical protein ACQH7H_23800, partial [Escherichia coli]|uniref:hypothetical protein n=1 Tax=Escherichia coli TaxID=562 RepID=UPI003CE9A2EC
FTPIVKFKDGLPKDEMEMAQIASTRTGGAITMSQKTALMYQDDLTEEQAEREIERIKEEQEAMQSTFADPSIFNGSSVDSDEEKDSEDQTVEEDTNES